MLVSALQDENADSPMVRTLDMSPMLVSLRQPENALSPMLVALLKSPTETRFDV